MTRMLRKTCVPIAVLRNAPISLRPKNHLILSQNLFIKKLDGFQNSCVSVELIYFRNSNLRDFLVSGNAATIRFIWADVKAHLFCRVLMRLHSMIVCLKVVPFPYSGKQTKERK